MLYEKLERVSRQVSKHLEVGLKNTQHKPTGASRCLEILGSWESSLLLVFDIQLFNDSIPKLLVHVKM